MSIVDILKSASSKDITQKKHATNPYRVSSNIKTKKKYTEKLKKKKYLLDGDTGEVEEGIETFKVTTEIDRRKFVKVYPKEICNIFGAGKSGVRVFAYILTLIKFNNLEIRLDIPDVMEYCQYKYRTQAYRGIQELKKCGLIAQSVKNNIWYVNPDVVFNGDKVSFSRQFNLTDEDEVKAKSSKKKRTSHRPKKQKRVVCKYIDISQPELFPRDNF